MIIDWFRGIVKKDDLRHDKYNGDWKRFTNWWNDHDNGVRVWDNVTATNITVSGATGTLIMTDTVNGHTYQILMVDGVLSTKQIT